MASNKKYWKSVEELNPNNAIVETLKQNEFAEPIPTDAFLGDKDTLGASSTTRRDFLKYVGFTTAAASLAACEGPVIKSIPYVVAPDEIIPGVANYYATAMADGFDFASILVKTREGRPIKIERNDLAKHGGNVNARVHASVLSMYDKNRLQGPKIEGEEVSWSDFDAAVSAKMNAMAGKDVVLLTQTFASPSTSKLIADFKTKYPNVRHVVYDTVSSSEALDAFQSKYNMRGLADYNFSKAEVIVSVGADFLGDWQGGGYEGSYAQGRNPKNGKMSRHIQFEANMTLSGANADKRIPVIPSQQLQVLKALTGNGNASGLPEEVADAVAKAKAQLQAAGSKGVVVTGYPSVEAQSMVLSYNEGVGALAMDVTRPKLTSMGSTSEVANVMNGVVSGSVKGLITVGVNPVYSFPNTSFAEAYKNLEMSLAFAMNEDETAVAAQMVAATPHYLESWGDVQIKKGSFGLVQPTIRPLFNTRQFQECLLKWTDNDTSYHDYLKTFWQDNILAGASWNQALHDGVFEGNALLEAEGDLSNIMESATSNGALLEPQEGGMELMLYTKTGLGDGQQANNPWLQELPDPITRASWDNYLTMAAADASAMGLVNEHVANGAMNGNYVNVKMGEVVIENVPVLIQPGQAKGSVGLALGYGRKAAIQSEMQTGVNAYALYNNFSSIQNVTLEKVSGTHEFACIQLQNTMMGRDIIRETSLEIFNTKDATVWNPMPMVSKDHEEIPATSPEADLWTSFDDSIGPHFNLSIDLNACTGCGACVIACHSENNVPVVGKAEMRKSRDMHWLRIDRYYSSEETFDEDVEKKESAEGWFTGEKKALREMEMASANPQVAFQPVMCQHCNHAPCETVCPVAATSHGRQGQNQMAYNRCVGTRYCANNCPYKVRRFNWFLYAENEEFDYYMNNDLGRMVLNPDVVVRSRGVMEKCSMCIQMTQKAILDAKKAGRPVKDSEFKTACSAACGTGAIQFGDVNDHESEVFKLKEDKRMYHLLESVGTKPNVFYHVKVRNTNEA
ncbi:MAG TPA: TAT-variant-translocated molybdopterin oxidoreductase [Flavobacteriaceae bacterium]|nr:TAT-variant-translocated molybdopterin oxidoreductase [Flavobacteriaceae bacterium]MCB9212264.1 TAT-variant-translocated molybdopterin oxidoreductase [Alteromonas sp.]HPF10357.1 TAT-variant-translocated molybdopterin oxidoreductase [Flavobacteriaceae bacterium]HQU20421.1 TAT-variant-translocated molybdopterin oxidoreductase [Flavobacteriaceae bacterium]HQU65759.1 TAT-variant-translocated molybdopterin oxidoreductase [Flavobacteriaceae bacterium]